MESVELKCPCCDSYNVDCSGHSESYGECTMYIYECVDCEQGFKAWYEEILFECEKLEDS